MNKKIIGLVVILLLLVIAFFSMIIATKSLNETYFDNFVKRVNSQELSFVCEIEQSSLLSKSRDCSITLNKDKIGFKLRVVSHFLPFSEENFVTIYNLNGKSISCEYCNYQKLFFSGNYDVNYISNTFAGLIEQPNYEQNIKDSGSMKLSNIMATFNGDFATKTMNLVFKAENISTINSITKEDRNFEQVEGTFNFKIEQEHLLVSTDNFSIGKFKYFDHESERILDIKNILFKFTETVNANPNLIDITPSLTAKSITYDNQKLYNREFSVKDGALNLQISNTTNMFWVHFASVVDNILQFFTFDNHSFDYKLIVPFALNKTEILVNRLQFVSEQSQGLFKVDKGSSIEFKDVAGLASVEPLKCVNLNLLFKFKESFVDDLPNGEIIKQTFTNNDWMLHSPQDYKDEFSSKLSITNGHCSLGESVLSGC